jgi:TatD DNase family protein
MWIDTHCHLTDRRLAGQVPAVLERAAQAGVQLVISATSDIPDSAAAAKIAAADARVFCTAGVHPHEAKDVPADYIAQLEPLAASPRCLAIGEIGLDYHYDFSPRPAQQRLFAEQLALAARLGKPIVIHTREAWDDTLAIIRQSGADGRRIIFHSFTGDAAQVRQGLDLGACVSFSGIVTFRNASDIRQAALLVGDDRLMIETDAPYLSPEPLRAMKVNEPANVAHVGRFLANLRGCPENHLAEITSANAMRFFGITPISG